MAEKEEDPNGDGVQVDGPDKELIEASRKEGEFALKFVQDMCFKTLGEVEISGIDVINLESITQLAQKKLQEKAKDYEKLRKENEDHKESLKAQKEGTTAEQNVFLLRCYVYSCLSD